jgi:hypothetical protein
MKVKDTFKVLGGFHIKEIINQALKISKLSKSYISTLYHARTCVIKSKISAYLTKVSQKNAKTRDHTYKIKLQPS